MFQIAKADRQCQAECQNAYRGNSDWRLQRRAYRKDKKGSASHAAVRPRKQKSPTQTASRLQSTSPTRSRRKIGGRNGAVPQRRLATWHCAACHTVEMTHKLATNRTVEERRCAAVGERLHNCVLAYTRRRENLRRDERIRDVCCEERPFLRWRERGADAEVAAEGGAIGEHDDVVAVREELGVRAFGRVALLHVRRRAAAWTRT